MVTLASKTPPRRKLRNLRIIKRLNLDSLRQFSNLDYIILSTFDELNPGQTMVVTDVYNPGWVPELLDAKRLDRHEPVQFYAVKHNQRHELYVIRPSNPNRNEHVRDIPEQYLG